MKNKKDELNSKYVQILKKMRILNAKRFEIYIEFKEQEPVKIEMMRTPSMYHDLYGNDLDLIQ